MDGSDRFDDNHENQQEEAMKSNNNILMCNHLIFFVDSLHHRPFKFLTVATNPKKQKLTIQKYDNKHQLVSNKVANKVYK
jgi:hypothetical protein